MSMSAFVTDWPSVTGSPWNSNRPTDGSVTILTLASVRPAAPEKLKSPAWNV